MNYCTIKNSRKVLVAEEMLPNSSEFNIISTANKVMEDEGRDLELDDIPGANSEPYFRKSYNVKTLEDLDYIDKEDILLGSQSVEEINSNINQEHKDLEVLLTEGDSVVYTKILHRPSEYTKQTYVEDIDTSYSPLKNRAVLYNALERLKKYYGINIHEITSDNLKLFPELNAQLAEAFIYNGEIYINTDLAHIDAPIHELLHLFLGSMRYNNTLQYFNIISSIENSPSYNEIALYYPNRTLEDLDEEVFVTELAKYVTGLKSYLDSLPKGDISTLMYNIKRDIDSVINGHYSVKSLENNTIFNSSILKLSQFLLGTDVNMKTLGSLTDSYIHRITANTKSELLKNNELILDCG